MVFLVTKAALAATLVGIGVTFGALSYLAAQKDRENNNNDGGKGFEISFPSKENPPTSSFQENNPSSSSSFSLFGVPADCNCKVVTECSTLPTGRQFSFRFGRTCGFQGFQRKVCCDEVKFFNTPPPLFALDEIKSVQAQLATPTACVHNHDEKGDFSTCSCDHGDDYFSAFGGSAQEEANKPPPGSLRDDTVIEEETSTLPPAVEDIESTTQEARRKISFPDLKEYFPDDESYQDNSSHNSSSLPFETALVPNAGTTEGVTAALGESISDSTSKYLSSKFPSLEEYFPEDNKGDHDEDTSGSGGSHSKLSTTEISVGGITSKTNDTNDAATSPEDVTTTSKPLLPDADKDQLETTTVVISADNLTTSSSKTDEAVNEMKHTTSDPDIDTRLGTSSRKDEEVRTVISVIMSVETTITSAIEMATEASTLKHVSSSSTSQEFPDVTEMVINGAHGGTQRPQSLELDKSATVNDSNAITSIPEIETTTILSQVEMTTVPPQSMTTLGAPSQDGADNSSTTTEESQENVTRTSETTTLASASSSSSDRRPFSLDDRIGDLENAGEQATTKREEESQDATTLMPDELKTSTIESGRSEHSTEKNADNNITTPDVTNVEDTTPYFEADLTSTSVRTSAILMESSTSTSVPEMGAHKETDITTENVLQSSSTEELETTPTSNLPEQERRGTTERVQQDEPQESTTKISEVVTTDLPISSDTTPGSQVHVSTSSASIAKNIDEAFNVSSTSSSSPDEMKGEITEPPFSEETTTTEPFSELTTLKHGEEQENSFATTPGASLDTENELVSVKSSTTSSLSTSHPNSEVDDVSPTGGTPETTTENGAMSENTSPPPSVKSSSTSAPEMTSSTDIDDTEEMPNFYEVPESLSSTTMETASIHETTTLVSAGEKDGVDGDERRTTTFASLIDDITSFLSGTTLPPDPTDETGKESTTSKIEVMAMKEEDKVTELTAKASDEVTPSSTTVAETVETTENSQTSRDERFTTTTSRIAESSGIIVPQDGTTMPSDFVEKSSERDGDLSATTISSDSSSSPSNMEMTTARMESGHTEKVVEEVVTKSDLTIESLVTTSSPIEADSSDGEGDLTSTTSPEMMNDEHVSSSPTTTIRVDGDTSTAAGEQMQDVTAGTLKIIEIQVTTPKATTEEDTNQGVSTSSSEPPAQESVTTTEAEGSTLTPHGTSDRSTEISNVEEEKTATSVVDTSISEQITTEDGNQFAGASESGTTKAPQNLGEMETTTSQGATSGTDENHMSSSTQSEATTSPPHNIEMGVTTGTPSNDDDGVPTSTMETLKPDLGTTARMEKEGGRSTTVAYENPTTTSVQEDHSEMDDEASTTTQVSSDGFKVTGEVATGRRVPSTPSISTESSQMEETTTEMGHDVTTTSSSLRQSNDGEHEGTTSSLQKTPSSRFEATVEVSTVSPSTLAPDFGVTSSVPAENLSVTETDSTSPPASSEQEERRSTSNPISSPPVADEITTTGVSMMERTAEESTTTTPKYELESTTKENGRFMETTTTPHLDDTFNDDEAATSTMESLNHPEMSTTARIEEERRTSTAASDNPTTTSVQEDHSEMDDEASTTTQVSSNGFEATGEEATGRRVPSTPSISTESNQLEETTTEMGHDEMSTSSSLRQSSDQEQKGTTTPSLRTTPSPDEIELTTTQGREGQNETPVTTTEETVTVTAKSSQNDDEGSTLSSVSLSPTSQTTQEIRSDSSTATDATTQSDMESGVNEIESEITGKPELPTTGKAESFMLETTTVRETIMETSSDSAAESERGMSTTSSTADELSMNDEMGRTTSQSVTESEATTLMLSDTKPGNEVTNTVSVAVPTTESSALISTEATTVTASISTESSQIEESTTETAQDLMPVVSTKMPTTTFPSLRQSSEHEQESTTLSLGTTHSPGERELGTTTTQGHEVQSETPVTTTEEAVTVAGKSSPNDEEASTLSSVTTSSTSQTTQESGTDLDMLELETTTKESHGVSERMENDVTAKPELPTTGKAQSFMLETTTARETTTETTLDLGHTETSSTSQSESTTTQPDAMAIEVVSEAPVELKDSTGKSDVDELENFTTTQSGELGMTPSSQDFMTTDSTVLSSSSENPSTTSKVEEVAKETTVVPSSLTEMDTERGETTTSKIAGERTDESIAVNSTREPEEIIGSTTPPSDYTTTGIPLNEESIVGTRTEKSTTETQEEDKIRETTDNYGQAVASDKPAESATGTPNADLQQASLIPDTTFRPEGGAELEVTPETSTSTAKGTTEISEERVNDNDTIDNSNAISQTSTPERIESTTTSENTEHTSLHSLITNNVDTNSEDPALNELDSFSKPPTSTVVSSEIDSTTAQTDASSDKRLEDATVQPSTLAPDFGVTSSVSDENLSVTESDSTSPASSEQEKEMSTSNPISSPSSDEITATTGASTMERTAEESTRTATPNELESTTKENDRFMETTTAAGGTNLETTMLAGLIRDDESSLTTTTPHLDEPFNDDDVASTMESLNPEMSTMARIEQEEEERRTTTVASEATTSSEHKIEMGLTTGAPSHDGEEAPTSTMETLKPDSGTTARMEEEGDRTTTVASDNPTTSAQGDHSEMDDEASTTTQSSSGFEVTGEVTTGRRVPSTPSISTESSQMEETTTEMGHDVMTTSSSLPQSSYQDQESTTPSLGTTLSPEENEKGTTTTTQGHEGQSETPVTTTEEAVTVTGKSSQNEEATSTLSSVTPTQESGTDSSITTDSPSQNDIENDITSMPELPTTGKAESFMLETTTVRETTTETTLDLGRTETSSSSPTETTTKQPEHDAMSIETVSDSPVDLKDSSTVQGDMEMEEDHFTTTERGESGMTTTIPSSQEFMTTEGGTTTESEKGMTTTSTNDKLEATTIILSDMPTENETTTNVSSDVVPTTEYAVSSTESAGEMPVSKFETTTESREFEGSTLSDGITTLSGLSDVTEEEQQSTTPDPFTAQSLLSSDVGGSTESPIQVETSSSSKSEEEVTGEFTSSKPDFTTSIPPRLEGEAVTQVTTRKDDNELTTTENVLDDMMIMMDPPHLVSLSNQNNSLGEDEEMTATEASVSDTHASYAGTTEYSDQEMVSTTSSFSMDDDESTMGEDEMMWPVTEITKSVRREPDKDKTVVELVSMQSRVKSRTKVTHTVNAVRTGSERSISEYTTEGTSTTTTTDGYSTTPLPTTTSQLTDDGYSTTPPPTSTSQLADDGYSTTPPPTSTSQLTEEDGGLTTTTIQSISISDDEEGRPTLEPPVSWMEDITEDNSTETDVMTMDFDGEEMNETIMFDTTTTGIVLNLMDNVTESNLFEEVLTTTTLSSQEMDEGDHTTSTISANANATVLADGFEMGDNNETTTNFSSGENLETTTYSMVHHTNSSGTTSTTLLDEVTSETSTEPVMSPVSLENRTDRKLEVVTVTTTLPANVTESDSTLPPESEIEVRNKSTTPTSTLPPSEITEKSVNGVVFDDFTTTATESSTAVDFEIHENATTPSPSSASSSSSYDDELYDTIFGSSSRSRFPNISNLESESEAASTTSRTTTTSEPAFTVEVKVGPHDARSLFSSQSTSAEKALEGEISNVVSQLLLTTHKNFNLLPSFVECAGARARGRRKTRVLHFDTDNYPWMARVGYKEPGGVTFPCAGTIISRRYILTSAYCATRKSNAADPSIMEVLLEGAKNAAAGLSDQLRYKYKVEQVVPHPNFDPLTRENDLALIRLGNEIPFNTSTEIKPICLPFEDGYGVWDSLPNEGETAYLGGWGYGLKNMAAEVEKMDEAAVTIWSTDNCTHLYRGDRAKRITPKNICAYGKAEKDSCRGDIGGPLMALMTRQRIFFQIGIVSYGPRCGYGVPGVYTRVSPYLSWVLDSMEP